MALRKREASFRIKVEERRSSRQAGEKKAEGGVLWRRKVELDGGGLGEVGESLLALEASVLDDTGVCVVMQQLALLDVRTGGWSSLAAVVNSPASEEKLPDHET